MVVDLILLPDQHIHHLLMVKAWSSHPCHHELAVSFLHLYRFRPTPFNKSITVNSLLSPRSPPLSQGHHDVSTVSGCIQRLPVWDLLLSQLQAHEHWAAGKPQHGVKVN